MTWPARIGWLLLAVATLAAAAAVFLIDLPEPHATVVVDRADYVTDAGTVPIPVTLPHVPPFGSGDEPHASHYTAHFDLAAASAEPLFLFAPAVNRRLSLALNGERLFDSGNRAFLAGPLVSAPVLVNIPPSLLRVGRNELRLTFESGPVALSSYLSKIYIGTESELVPNFKLRALLQERLIVVTLGAQILLGVAIVCAYFMRPRDPLFSWLAALVVVASIVSASLFAEYGPDFPNTRPYAAALSPAIGFLFIGVALAIVEVPPPKILRLLTVAVPAALMLGIAAGLLTSISLVAATSFLIVFVALVVAAAIVAWGVVFRRGAEARLMLSPFLLICCFAARDISIAAGFVNGSVLLGPYARLLFLAVITATLMRRLAISLHGLDHANENLNRKLAEREAELDALHRQERMEAARFIREHERQRLTRDLHDGISGHLVSIIAMAERAGGEVQPIEQAARQALDDLRLVIYSLDLGDRELPLALANFRERLIPQLKRLGVELDWSTAELPEVSGVTPGNALTILRIMQEAITNALKHGPARRIAIRGAAVDGNKAAIVVENDGRPFVVERYGNGLRNMRRRADQLKGEIALEPLDSGTRLLLLLPTSLPDVQDELATAAP